MLSESLLDAVHAIALESGQRILAIYNSEFAVQHKDDESPLTQADLASHQHIVESLAKIQPHLPVLSEESAAIPFSERKSWPRYWLVDPLDGTKEFIKRNGEFTVNIALIEDGAPILGVVHAPALGVTYAGARDAGAFKVQGHEKTRLATRKLPAVPAYVVSRSHQDAALEKLLERAPRHEALSRGSSLKFCQVAEGSADFYPRTGPTSEWDTAAGQCVVEQAGGAVWRLPDLAPLRYNQKDSLLNPGFAVMGDPSFDWAALLRG